MRFIKLKSNNENPADQPPLRYGWRLIFGVRPRRTGKLPMLNTLASVLIGIASTLITLFLSPRLQHYFWGHQRMSELRLRVLERLNSLAAEFLYNYLEDRNFRPDDQFFRSLMVLTADIKLLFSQQTFDRFKELEVMIGPNLGSTGRGNRGNVEAFINARDAALRAIYAEAVSPRLF